MAFLKHTNRAISTLDGNITDVAVTLDVQTGDGTLFPATGDFHITCEDEIMNCTSRAGDTLTIVRGQEGTSNVAHVDGRTVELRITSGFMDQCQSPRTATFVVAANDSSALGKLQADYVCDGTADDVQIQAAIDAVSALGGGKVVLLEGTFVLAAIITVDSDITLVGQGIAVTILQGTGAGTFYRVVTNSEWVTGNMNIVVRDMTIDGNWATGAISEGGTLHLCKVTRSLIERVEAKNTYTHGFEIVRSQNVTVRGCIARDIKGDDGFSISDGALAPGGGAGISESRYITLIDNYAYDTLDGASKSCFEIDDGPAYVTLIGNTADKTGIAGFTYDTHMHVGEVMPKHITVKANIAIAGDLAFGAGRTVSEYSEYITIVDNQISSGDILLWSGYQSTIANNAIDQGGIRVDGVTSPSKQVSVVNNHISYLGAGGNTAVLIADAAFSIDIIGNQIQGDGTSDDAGIFLATGKKRNINVIGNTIEGMITKYGIWIWVQSAGDYIDHVNIALNTIRDVNHGFLLWTEAVSGGATDVWITQNMMTNCTNKVTTQYLAANNEFYFRDNPDYVASGEHFVEAGSLTAGAANAFAFAWQNPHASKILIDYVIVEVTTAGGTATAVLDVDVVANATSTGNDILDGIDLNATALYDSRNDTDNGTNGEGRAIKCDENGGANDYVTSKILVEAAASLVGKYYIYYTVV